MEFLKARRSRLEGVKKRTAVTAQGWHGRPTHRLTGVVAQRLPFFSLSPPSAVRHAVGRLEAPMLIPRPDDHSHLVRPCERCSSDLVADRSSALHPEAPNRGGWSARLAPTARAGWPSGSMRSRHTRHRFPSPVDPPEPQQTTQPLMSSASIVAVTSRYGQARIAQVPDFLRVT
jgi:hypothetical protein